MEKLIYKLEGDKLKIGSQPQLIINLNTQENYIQTNDRVIPYRKKVVFSQDLLAGKREAVMQTALTYYYQQACQIAKEMQIAEDYRKNANRTIREKR